MKKIMWLVVTGVLIFVLLGCNRAEEPKKIQAFKEETNVGLPTTTAAVELPSGQAPGVNKAPQPTDVVAEVDGKKMTRAQLDGALKKKLAPMAGKIPAERLPQVSSAVRKQIIDDFIMRTLLVDELNRLKITAGEQEISSALVEMKGSLPEGVTLEETMKKAGITMEQLRQEISLDIRINKMLANQRELKTPPTEKEIETFYKTNKEKFKIPESVNVRHILLAKKAGEDDKAKAARHEKAEKLRQQLLAGSDFAELARANSDCPSKKHGGDLGNFSRGQMVKPFETAAFTQKINEIGPVIETEYGYHILQVLAHHQERTKELDRDTKNQISGFLKEKKKYDAFNRIMKQLKAKARIVVTDVS